MSLHDTLHALCADHGLPMPRPDEDGIHALVMNGVTVNFIPADTTDHFIVQACLGQTDGCDSGVLENMMVENLSPDSCSGVLGCDDEGFVFLTWRCADPHPGYTHALATLGRFAARAARWQQCLGAQTPAA